MARINIALDNEGVAAQVAALLEQLQPLLPSWLETLEVRSASPAEGDGHEYARCIAAPEYRSATFVVGYGWSRIGEDSREQAAIHELVHVPTWEVRRLVGELLDEAQASEILKRHANRQIEAMVDDLAFGIQRLLHVAYQRGRQDYKKELLSCHA